MIMGMMRRSSFRISLRSVILSTTADVPVCSTSQSGAPRTFSCSISEYMVSVLMLKGELYPWQVEVTVDLLLAPG